MRPDQRGMGLFLEKLKDESQLVRRSLGLPIFSKLEEFKAWNKTDPQRQSKIEQRVIDEKASEILFKCGITPLPQNIKMATEYILIGDSNIEVSSPWPPYEALLSKKRGIAPYFFFKVYDDVRREHVIDWWKKCKRQIEFIQENFLRKVPVGKTVKVLLDKRGQLVKLYIFSNTELKHVKNSWSLVNELKEQLPKHSSKSRPISKIDYESLNEIDKKKFEEYDGEMTKMTDRDKADKFHRDISPGALKRKRYTLNKLKRGE
jgi:hypothetical protein